MSRHARLSGWWAHPKEVDLAAPWQLEFESHAIIMVTCKRRNLRSQAKSDCAKAIRIRQPPLNSLVGRLWSWIDHR